MKLTSLLWFWLCMSLICGNLIAQSNDLNDGEETYLSTIRHFNLSDGLPDRIIFDVIQGDQGYIWIACNQGLVQWDGHEFNHFDQATYRLPFLGIQKIVPTGAGKFWLSPLEKNVRKREGEWHCLDLPNDTLLNFNAVYPGIAEQFFPEDFKLEIISDKFLAIWGDKKLILFNNQTGEQREVLQEDQNQIKYIYPESETAFWLNITNPKGKNYLRFIDLDQGIRKEWPIPKGIKVFGKTDSQSRGLVKDDALRFWFVRDMDHGSYLGYLYVSEDFEQLTWKSLIQVPASKDMQVFNYNPASKLAWLLYPDRLIVWKEGVGVICHLKEDDFPEELGFQIECFFPSAFPNSAIFVGSEGLVEVMLRPKLFQTYLDGHEPRISTRGIVVDSSGIIYINRLGGWNVIDPSQEGFVKEGKHYLPSFKKGLAQINRKLEDAEHGLCSYIDSKNRVWGNLFHSVIQMNLDIEATSDEDIPIHTLPYSFNGVFFEFENDPEDLIWLVSEHDLFQLYPEREFIIRYNKYNDLVASFDGSMKHYCLQEDDQSFWICTDNGLYLFDRNEGLKARYHDKGEGGFYFPHNAITQIYKDTNEIYWASTKGGGLIRWNRESETFRQFTIRDGLSNNVLYAVYPDNQGRLWLPSNYGLMAFDPASSSTSLYLPEDGLAHEEFNTYSHFRDKNGKLYFGGLNGIITFHPDSISNKLTRKNIPLVLTRVLVEERRDGQMKDVTRIVNASNELIVSPSQGYVSIHASLLDFHKPEQHTYAFKVEGLEKEWTYQSRPDYKIPKVSYGHYKLQVRAKNADGQWSEMTIELPITFRAPFYRQMWFLILISSCILGGIFYLFYWRVKWLQKQRDLLEAMVSERTIIVAKQAAELRELDKVKSRFFANVSHELRTPLTLVLGPIRSMLKRTRLGSKEWNSLRTAERNARQLLELVNEILDLSKLNSDKVELKDQAIGFHSFIDRIIGSFESHAQHQGIRFVKEFNASPHMRILIDPKKMEKVLNNLLSNAFKFTEKGGQVSLKVMDKQEVISIQVRDTGRGIHPEDIPHVFDRFYQSNQPDAPTEGGTGIGLALCSEYAKLFGGSISLESKLGEGSTFCLTFPKREVLGVPAVTESKISIGNIETADEGHASHESIKFVDPISVPKPEDLKNRPQLLIVEDNHGLRQYLNSILKDNFVLTLTQNGQEAMEAVEEFHKKGKPFHLILSDIMMPIMDGFTLLENLKSSDDTRHIPVIMLTARADMQDKLKALRIGVDDYLVKPFDEEELLARIQNLLQYASSRSASGSPEKDGHGDGDVFDPSQTKEDGNEAIMTAADVEWLQDLEIQVVKHISDFNFQTEILAEKLFISRRQLGRRLKKLTGLTPNAYLTEFRLQKAKELLELGQVPFVKNAAYQIGFKDVHYFTKKFKERFGRSPTDYLE